MCFKPASDNPAGAPRACWAPGLGAVQGEAAVGPGLELLEVTPGVDPADLAVACPDQGACPTRSGHWCWGPTRPTARSVEWEAGGGPGRPPLPASLGLTVDSGEGLTSSCPLSELGPQG